MIFTVCNFEYVIHNMGSQTLDHIFSKDVEELRVISFNKEKTIQTRGDMKSSLFEPLMYITYVSHTRKQKRPQGTAQASSLCALPNNSWRALSSVKHHSLPSSYAPSKLKRHQDKNPQTHTHFYASIKSKQKRMTRELNSFLVSLDTLLTVERHQSKKTISPGWGQCPTIQHNEVVWSKSPERRHISIECAELTLYPSPKEGKHQDVKVHALTSSQLSKIYS